MTAPDAEPPRKAPTGQATGDRAPAGDPLRVAVIGGGPGGLYAAALLKRLDPRREITVWERNAADDTFGFGVVLSDETLGGIEHADPVIYRALQEEFVRWDDIDIVHRGRTLTSGGHGFAALGRRRLLEILHERCASLGVGLRFRTPAPPAAELATTHDLVIAADGVNSHTREAHADAFVPHITTAPLPVHLAGRRLRLRRVPLRDRRDRARRDAAARLSVLPHGTRPAPCNG